jgi:outer membrane protein OmpA-like peptidoglycan-associated protein
VIVVTLAATSAACASKKFVRSSVGAANQKVNTLIRSLEETQTQTARHERRIADVDAKTGAAARSADTAHGVARGAAHAARAAGTRIEALDKASKKLLYDVAMTTDEANFDFGGAELPDGAKVRIDGMIHELVDDPKNVFIEIEGHTDDRGANATNVRVGLARAQAVQKYLYDVHQVPLHKMNIISFGEDRPVTSNKTDAGRAQNRRVVIRIRA